jgi:hypothetical protein
MDDTTRPNIVNIGLLAGAVSTILGWLWNALGPLPMDVTVQGAFTTILIYASQFLDKRSKAAVSYAAAAYGGK